MLRGMENLSYRLRELGLFSGEEKASVISFSSLPVPNVVTRELERNLYKGRK